MREALDVSALRTAVGSRWPHLTVVDETASTNEDLLADRGAPDHSLLVAEHQSAGRGRLDRTWVSAPRSGLTVSVLLRPPVAMARWAWLPLLTGVALQETVAEQTGLAASLKWPNDLLLVDPDGEHRKAAGILAQTEGPAVVVGVGVNVSTTVEELPVPTATSLARAGAADVDRTRLLIGLLDAFERRYTRWLEADGDAERSGLAAAYLDACETIGRRVRVTGVDGTDHLGIACGIDSSGRLQVETASGCQVVGAGDVEHVRDAPA